MGCKDKGIRKFEFVAKNELLSVGISNLNNIKMDKKALKSEKRTKVKVIEISQVHVFAAYIQGVKFKLVF